MVKYLNQPLTTALVSPYSVVKNMIKFLEEEEEAEGNSNGDPFEALLKEINPRETI